MWNDLKNKIISYDNDTTLYAKVSSPSDYINVTNSLNRVLLNIKSGCSLFRMNFNPNKTHSLLSLD